MTIDTPIIGELLDDVLTHDLGPFFENSYGDKYLYSVNGSSFANLSADAVYADFFGNDHFQKEGLYLVVGSDSGLLLKYVVEQGASEESKFIFLELPEVIERLPEVVDLEGLPETVHISTLDNLSETLTKVHARHYIYSKQIYTQPSLSSMDLNLTGYAELYAEVQAAMSRAVWNTELHLGNHGFVERQIENMAENRLSSICLKDFKDQLKGKTVAVLGVGPSLDDILPWVEENQKNLFIIAVSRASRRLEEVGLCPHIIVSVDPSVYSFDVSREMLFFSNDAIFVHGPHVSPPLVGNWPGKHLYMGQRFPWTTDLNVAAFPPHGPTVTQTALSIAVEMGFSQVVLGGVDLCFNKEGQVYGKTTQGREKGLNPGTVHGGVETNGGWNAETSHAFVGGIQVTGEIAGAARQNDCRVVNLAIGAANIPNVDFLPPEKVDLEPMEISPVEIITQIAAGDNKEAEIEYYQDVLAELARAKHAYKKIEQLSEKAIQVNTELFSGSSKGGKKKELDKIERQFNEDYSEFAKFAKNYGVLKFLKIVRPGKDTVEKYDDAEKAGRLYYEAYRDTSRALIALIEKGEKRLRFRLEETADLSDYTELLKYWDDGKLYGRAEIVKANRPDFFDNINEKERLMLDAMEERLDRFLQRQEDFSPTSKLKGKDYKALNSQVQMFFLRKEKSALQILANDLVEDDTEKGRALYQLCRGYLKELAGDQEGALSCYELVINADDKLVLEKALSRVAAISFTLQDNANLKLAIECLAGISPLYIPKYADLLWLEGDVEAALEHYVRYLNIAPTDLLSMMKLGRYYLEAGSLEGGRIAFEYVLGKDPDNRTAIKMLNDIKLLEANK